MALNIPMSPVKNDIFSDVMDYWERLQQQKQKQPLLDAQARQANAMAGREEALGKLPFGGRQMPGAVGQLLGLKMVGEKYGYDSPEYQEYKKAYDLSQKKLQSTIDYQQNLIDTSEKRTSTPRAKAIQEESEIDRGVMPGTSSPSKPGVPLSPEQKDRLKSVYNLETLNKITDSNLRERALSSNNVDTTFDKINPDDLFVYSGPQGYALYLKDKAQDLKGNPPDRYLRYEEAESNAKLLKKQIRQTYKDSVTQGAQQGLELIINPTSATRSSKAAIAKFKSARDTIKREGKLFRDALTNPKAYGEKQSASSNKPKYSQQQLDTWAQEARDAGVSEEKIKSKMKELQGQ